MPSRIICMDKSMSKWINMWSCPGFVLFLAEKPWPQGNEYHMIACGETSIIFRVELMEGKYRPDEIGKKLYEKRNGKTVELLLRMIDGIWISGRVIILDSGFCILRGIIELSKVGLFASALIKKRRY